MTRIITREARRCIKNLAIYKQKYLTVIKEDKDALLDDIVQEIQNLLVELDIK